MTNRISRYFSLLLVLVSQQPLKAQVVDVAFETAFDSVTFNLPVGLRFGPEGEHLYVLEHRGLIKVLPNDAAATEASIFLDMSERLDTDPRGELLGLAFHPSYTENGLFFVRYKLENPHRTLLARFSRSEVDPLRADVSSEVVLFEVETPGNMNNHHGGDLAFGPDGYLYLSMGDGGTQYDEAGNAQNLGSLLGKVLRIDVDGSDGGRPYAIPPDNPFSGQAPEVREEIFAVGFRNPWRLTIDEETGDVWVGDVGEEEWEEINRVSPGGNYGWPIMEGPNCLLHVPCDTTGLITPVWSYGRDLGISVTGGYIYRGEDIPDLIGKYVFADWGLGNVWALDPDEEPVQPMLITHTPFNMTSFAEDPSGELFVTRYFNGTIGRLSGPEFSDSEDDVPFPAHALLDPPYPNPAVGAATIQFKAARGGLARLALYDVLGREVARLFDGRVLDGSPQKFEISTDGWASGVYFIRLQTDEGVEVQTLFVMQ